MVEAKTSDGEVLGVAVNVCIDGVMSVFQARMRDILDNHDIERPDPHPDEWYPLDKFMQVLEAVETDVGENALRKIGEATPQFVDWPKDADSPEAALNSLVDIIEDTHRNVPGEYIFEQTGDESGRITSTTPYPEAWETGFFTGTAEIHGSSYTRVNTINNSSEKVYEIEW